MAEQSKPQIELVRIQGDIPSNADPLRLEARLEGFHFIERLYDEWASGKNTFSQKGEILFAAYVENKVAGIGGLTVDPAYTDALRMRRFFVRKDFRRYGVATQLVSSLIDQTKNHQRNMTVNAGTADAPAFWEAMGFTATEKPMITHILTVIEA